MTIELLIEHAGKVFAPCVVDEITWTTERKGSPSALKFSVLKDGVLNFQEGDAVRLRADGENVFFGFVFTKKRNKDGCIAVTAYDQLRYLKNKDSYLYTGKTASQVVQMIAEDFKLKTGKLSATSFVIPYRSEPDTTLFDIVQNAIDLELQNSGALYCLWDDFGKLALDKIENRRLSLVIDCDTAEDFDYASSIDSDTFNQIKLTHENKKTGTREVYIAKDGSHINSWGVLQHTEKLENGENGKAKADALLRLYNAKKRTLQVSNCLGDVRCRAGTMPVIRLNLGDTSVSQYMLVEKAVHTFSAGTHLMSLNLLGGGFSA